MPRNRIRIVSNQNTKSISFFFWMKEREKWSAVSNYSELSRRKYTSANIFDAGETILSVIERDYNIGGQGVDVWFAGPEDEFNFLQQCIDRDFKDKNMMCNREISTIAVAGKIGSGKSTLIEKMCTYAGDSFSLEMLEGYEKYTACPTNTIWYEIAGIDMGNDNVSAVQKIFDSLAGKGVTAFIYCILTGKIEKPEEDFIAHVRRSCPGIKILLLLTKYLEENDHFAEQLSGQLDGIKVIPVLAKSVKMRRGMIEAYGLDEVSAYLFEGM